MSNVEISETTVMRCGSWSKLSQGACSLFRATSNLADWFLSDGRVLRITSVRRTSSGPRLAFAAAAFVHASNDGGNDAQVRITMTMTWVLMLDLTRERRLAASTGSLS